MQMQSFAAAVCLLGCVSHQSRHSEHARSHGDGHLLAMFVELAVDAAFTSSGDDAPADPGEDFPDRVDHDMAAYALIDALPALQQCATAAPIPMTVTVRPNGEIESVQVQAAASQQCVTLALGGLDFPRTVHGGRFRWTVPAVPPRPPPAATPEADTPPAAAGG
jgi:hypothetical protein